MLLFTLIGSMFTEDKALAGIFELFDDQEKLVCNPLFSCINNGSLSALNVLYTATDPPMVDKYLEVFRSIFEETNHGEHYKMMMANSYVECEPTPTGY